MSEAVIIETLRIPSTLDQLALVDSEVERIARDLGFSDGACSDLGICVTEAAINAIIHAHHERADLTVEIRFERVTDALQIVVRDYGAGYNPADIPDPTLPENLLKAGGRGVHLIRSLMDKLEIMRLADGMQLTMIKKRST
jgi:serine/threonine-protein kinase RsbW